MSASLWILPSADMDFWKINNEEMSVIIKWTRNCFEDYKELAYQFYECGYKTFEDVIKNGYDNIKSDMDYIVQALHNLGGEASYPEIYAEYERISGVQLTHGRKAGIRKSIEDHSSDSLNYKGREDLFYSVYGLGNGVWGLR